MDENSSIVELLKQYHQDHVVTLLNNLEEEKKIELIEQIKKIDFNQLEELYNSTKKEIEIKENKIEAIPFYDKAKLSKEEKEQYDKKGIEAIKKGEYAVVTMAGGQGTRLGYDGPKGTFKLDIYGKGKYVFEILIENMKNASKEYNIIIPWYIMTSKDNDKQTKEFFEKNNYFGYGKENVTFFMQGEMPLLNKEGKVLIGKDKKIKEASDGNGGVFNSLRTSGILSEMKDKGIKWIFIGGVDNVLSKPIDITLLGMTIEKNCEIASKSIVKSHPHEKVGVFCKMNGHPKIIEYSELTEKMAEETNNDGELKYGESNIACHLFTIDAIEKVSNEILMYHTAAKKNSFIDENGKEIIPKEPNSFKFEAFVFDSFEFFDDMVLLRVKREEEFAPIKNKEGADSPKTAKELYEKYWQKYENRRKI